jgi:hypothetical protein
LLRNAVDTNNVRAERNLFPFAADDVVNFRGVFMFNLFNMDSGLSVETFEELFWLCYQTLLYTDVNVFIQDFDLFTRATNANRADITESIQRIIDAGAAADFDDDDDSFEDNTYDSHTTDNFEDDGEYEMRISDIDNDEDMFY